VFAAVLAAVPGARVEVVGSYGPDLWSIHRMAQYVLRVLLPRLPRATPKILVGYSMGGFIADAILRDPEAVAAGVVGVVFISTANTATKHLLQPSIRAYVAAALSHLLTKPGEDPSGAFEEGVGGCHPTDDDDGDHDCMDALAGLQSMHTLDRAVMDKAKTLESMKDLMAQRLAWKQQAMAILVWILLEPAEAGPRPQLPVLVIHGTMDRLVPPASARGLCDHYAPHGGASLHVVPGIGHKLLAARREDIGAALLRWVQANFVVASG
jgi:pimeloyl-ACP methyl ester carboxylesterase